MIDAAVQWDYWRAAWESKVRFSPEVAAGRATYSGEEFDAVVADIVKGLNLEPSDTLLDIGCSKGLIGDMLRPYVGRYVGMDYVHGFRPMVTASAVSLPFKDGSFSKVLLAGVLIFIPHELVWSVFQEMCRVTKPGGRGFVASCASSWGDEMASCFQPVDLLHLAVYSGWTQARLSEPAECIKADRGYFDLVVVK